MAKSSVYTKTGDKGETALVSGARISKSDARIDLYGSVDELNSHIGYFLSHLNQKDFLSESDKELFQDIQMALFDLGSRLACEPDNWEKFKLPNVESSLVTRLESSIDMMDGELPKLKSFILPGGDVAASYGHVVRTVSRRVERLLVGMKNLDGEIPENSIEFLNRLSDFFFVYSRFINFKRETPEVLWQPKK